MHLALLYSLRVTSNDIGHTPFVAFYATLAEQSSSIHLQASLQMNLVLNITFVSINIIYDVISIVKQEMRCL